MMNNIPMTFSGREGERDRQRGRETERERGERGETPRERQRRKKYEYIIEF